MRWYFSRNLYLWKLYAMVLSSKSFPSHSFCFLLTFSNMRSRLRINRAYGRVLNILSLPYKLLIRFISIKTRLTIKTTTGFFSHRLKILSSMLNVIWIPKDFWVRFLFRGLQSHKILSISKSTTAAIPLSESLFCTSRPITSSVLSYLRRIRW